MSNRKVKVIQPQFQTYRSTLVSCKAESDGLDLSISGAFPGFCQRR